jgi:hypothetical protein
MDYPKDLIKQFEKTYSSVRIQIPVKHIQTPSRPEDMDFHFSIRANTSPLISGCLAGFSKGELSTIAQGHGVCPKDFIWTFETTAEIILSMDGTSSLSGDEVFRRCFEGLELACPDQIRAMHDEPKASTPFYMMAITTAASPKLWPKTIISEYNAANNAVNEDSSVANHLKFHRSRRSIFSAINNENHLPRDESGPRYDWFLDRVGMLLPAVTNKSLGYFSFWEDLVILASKPGDTHVHRLMDYCVDNPPLSLRPGILNGLRSMSMRSTEDTDGMALLLFLKNKLTGTWLEPILQNDIFKMNLLAHVDPYSRNSKIAHYPDVIGSLGVDQEHLAERVFAEILEMPPENISLAYFDAIGQSRAIKGDQVISQGFDREAFLSHLLKGAKCFLGYNRVKSKDLKEIRDIINYRCRQAFAMLSQDHQLDYGKFQDLHSEGIRFLVEQGFDRRRLPRMAPRDRGILLEDELGM